MYKAIDCFLLGASWPCLSSASREHCRTAATGWTTAKCYYNPCFIHTIPATKNTNSHLCREEPWVIGHEALFPSVDKT